ncbi:rhodanese-like domain-containing protein [Cytobacillus purgationiresistens]|uniref:Rhodanese-related sulfurtransferase n=1 Tax=Cytobacillus purgationiresistens TaxID=863449 RepID=A0ABU0AGR9_9BACI|nr:rhodanese-like domain-containing protein [Cytobacillus purgationiresistens]MDQ0270437.1 rhodanese-related sulfurtransferase [Cytobacillus purgationiresistens]
MEQILPSEVEQFIKSDKDRQIIDVREVEEAAKGKIPGAVHIPLGLLEFRLHELDKTKEYVMVCRSGGRSERATRLLEDHGYKVKNMAGGMMAWEGKTE